MSLKYKINEYAEYLECAVSGSYHDARSFNRQLVKLISQCHVSGRLGVLFDLKQMTGFPDATDRILIFAEIIQQNQKSMRAGKPQIRIVFLKDEMLGDRLNLSLDTDLAGKLPLATSSDPDKAIGWLAKTQRERKSIFSMDLMEFVHLRFHQKFPQSDSHLARAASLSK